MLNFPSSAPPQDRTLADLAARAMRDDILCGALPPGARLRLAPLSASLGISVGPIREALRRLDAEGLVEHVAHKGARVRDIGLDDLLDLYRVRIELERYAVGEATRRMTAIDASALDDTLTAYRRAYEEGRPRDGQARHADFHLGLYALAGSDRLLEAIRRLWDAAERYQRYAAALRGAIDRRYGDHKDLLDACMSGDATRAEQALEHHLRHSLDLIQTQVARNAPAAPRLDQGERP